MKKKIIALISGAVILIIAAGSIYGKSESGHKEGEPDVVGTFSVNRDENITVVANRGHIGDKEAFARELLQMYKDDSFYSTKFSTDRGYATSLDMNIYLWKEDIEDGESVMTAEYRPVEYGKDYDVVNNPDKFQLLSLYNEILTYGQIKNDQIITKNIRLKDANYDWGYVRDNEWVYEAMLYKNRYNRGNKINHGYPDHAILNATIELRHNP